MGTDSEGVENETYFLCVCLHVYICFSFHFEESFKVGLDMYAIHYT